MLNGIAPIFIFTFPQPPSNALLQSLAGVPVVGDILTNRGTGVPIPIYLDEQSTGLYVDSESKSLDVDIDVKAGLDSNTPKVNQQALDSTVNINLKASRDSILLSVLLALNDLVFVRVASQAYSISYLNGSTVVFNGLLKSFVTTVSDEDDLVRIQIQLSKANYKAPTPEPSTPVVPKELGATPSPRQPIAV